MVICSVCKQQSKEGKFCEVCGSPLKADSIDSGKKVNGLVGGFGAIKSNMKDGEVIWKVTRVPDSYEKTITVKENECVFIDDGTGVSKYTESLSTSRAKFSCYYVLTHFILDNDYELYIEIPIMNINKGEKLKVKIIFKLEMSPTDIEAFFKTFTSIKDDNWTTNEMKELIEEKIINSVKQDFLKCIENDYGFDLRDDKLQIKNCENIIKTNIGTLLSEYSLKLDKYLLSNICIDKYELNNILAKNLYEN